MYFLAFLLIYCFLQFFQILYIKIEIYRNHSFVSTTACLGLRISSGSEESLLRKTRNEFGWQHGESIVPYVILMTAELLLAYLKTTSASANSCNSRGTRNCVDCLVARRLPIRQILPTKYEKRTVAYTILVAAWYRC